jgi:malate synthase
LDRKGKQGSQDIAGIEDILVENNETIVIDFNAVNLDGASKIQAYRNLQAFLRSDLSTFIIENGQQKILRMRNDVSFTDINGDDYCIDNKAPIQIQCANRTLVSQLMCDNRGKLAPQIIMDVVFTTLIMRGVGGTSNDPTQNLLLLEQGSFTSEMTRRLDEILAIK